MLTTICPAPCFFQDAEWKALYGWRYHTTELPDKPPTLREAVRWIAMKGGFQGRNSDGHPGAEFLWHGIKLCVSKDQRGVVPMLKAIVKRYGAEIQFGYQYFFRHRGRRAT